MIIAITNAKGGVGKTTTSVNLAAGLAGRGRRTLLIDLDPQAHAYRCFLEEDPEKSVSELIMDKPSQASRSVIATKYTNLDIVPATAELIETAELLSGRIRREERLSRALEVLREDYRDIIIDCPPALGILVYNAVNAADLLIIPVQPGVGAVIGIDTLIETAQELRDEDIVPYRILISMLDVRTTHTNALIEELLEEYRRRLLKTIISKSEALNQANISGKPILRFKRNSRSVYEYDALCEEVIRLRIRTRA